MTIDSYFSCVKPKNGSYILGNQNHVGYYFKGYVYYWGFDCRRGYARRAKLEEWCDAWLYLKPCCIASEEEYRETMGGAEGFEPENYREFEVEKETKHELEKKLDIAVKALEGAFGMAKGGKSTLLQTPENSILAGIEIDCAIALKEIKGW